MFLIITWPLGKTSTSVGMFAVSASGESHGDQVFASCIRLDNVGGAECVSGNCLKERNQPWEYEVQNYPWVQLLPLPKTSRIIWSKIFSSSSTSCTLVLICAIIFPSHLARCGLSSMIRELLLTLWRELHWCPFEYWESFCSSEFFTFLSYSAVAAEIWCFWRHGLRCLRLMVWHTCIIKWVAIVDNS